MTRRIAIIGGGLGGITAALALQRFGMKVRLFERAPAFAEAGAGITIAPNASRIVDFLGLADEQAAISNKVRTQGVLHYETGEILVQNDRGDTPMERYGANYYQLHRADLHEMLAKAVAANDPEAIHLGKEFVSFEGASDGIQITFADGQIERTDLLIGCDGIHSRVRSCLFGETKPRFTGRIAWRGLVPMERVPDWDMPFESGLLNGPGRSLGFYLIRGQKLINYAALCTRDEWTEEGWNIKADVDEVLNEFEGCYGQIRKLISATPPEQLFKWGLFQHEPLPQWGKGNAVLLGDAAHAMLPYMGQGAAMAMEDAMVLARCLDKYDDGRVAFEHYENARKERTTMCQEESAAKGDRIESKDFGSYNSKKHRNEESIGLFAYNAIETPI